MTDPVTPRAGGTILGRTRGSPGEEPLDHATVEATFAGLAAEPIDTEAPAPANREPPVTGPGSRVTPWLVAGCVILVLAALALAALGLQQRRALHRDRDQQRQLRDVSGRTVAALTNYDYQHLDEWKKSVLANATGTFQGDFESAFSGFAAGYVAEQNRGTGTVQGVWLGPVDTDRATTVALVQITVTSLTGTHSLGPLFTQLTLLKVAGRWRVDQIAYFGTTGPGSTGGTTTTPTTVPGAPTTPTSVP